MLHPPVAADVGEEVFRRCLVRSEAGDVEDGLAARVPPAFLLVRGVALDEQGLLRVLEPGAVRCRQGADGAGLDPAAADLAGRGGDGRRFPGQPVQGLVQRRLVAQDRPQVVGVLGLPQVERVLPVRLHRVARDDNAVERERGEQRPEVADLVGLPGFRDLVLGDHDARHVGDGGEEVHLLVPSGLGALAFLAVDGDRPAGGNVPGIPGDGGVQPGVERVRPEPAVLPVLAEGFRGWRLPLLLPFLLLAPLLRAVRGIRGRDRGVERERGHRSGQSRLELVRVQQLPEPVQHRRGRRHPQPGPRADPAAVRGQHLLAPAPHGDQVSQFPRHKNAAPRHDPLNGPEIY